MAVSGQSMRSALEHAALPLQLFAAESVKAYRLYLVLAAYAGYVVWRSYGH